MPASGRVSLRIIHMWADTQETAGDPGSNPGEAISIRNLFILLLSLVNMMIGVTLVIILALIVAIWLAVTVKRVRHKIFAIFLIGLILFLYFSISSVFNGKELDIKDTSGVMDAAKIYFSWLGSFFSNLKSLTADVINMDWKGNSTEIE